MASDGEEGLIKAKAIRPALIICDWIMPRKNGLEVCSQIKSTPELSTTFFILLTSLDSVEDRVKGLDAGADDFLCKPIEMNELKARVRAGLRLHQLSKDLQIQKQLLETDIDSIKEWIAVQNDELMRLKAEREEQELIRAELQRLEQETSKKEEDNKTLRDEVGALDNQRHLLVQSMEKMESDKEFFQS